ncbi:MAG: hypothetical protein HQM00_13525 [Magnetococcales bacterium]|nr:hypothetical protein [Magnetococcales bacterium]
MARQSPNFSLYRGDTKVFALTFKTRPEGLPIDITGHRLWFTMKQSTDNTDEEAVLQKSIIFPETPASASGLGFLTLTSAETRAIRPGVYLYDMQWVIEGDPPVVMTLSFGRINVLPDVTRRDGA